MHEKERNIPDAFQIWMGMEYSTMTNIQAMSLQSHTNTQLEDLKLIVPKGKPLMVYSMFILMYYISNQNKLFKQTGKSGRVGRSDA